MAFTERYVTSAAGGGGDGSSGSPWTLAEAFANAAAGDRVNIQSDAGYSIGADTVTNEGTIADAIVFRGYNSAIGDLETQGHDSDGWLNTTNFPVITLTGILTPNRHVVFHNLKFTGSLSSYLIGYSSLDVFAFVSCFVENTANDASASCIRGDNQLRVIDCDLICSGASHTYVVDSDASTIMINSRFKLTADANATQSQGIVAVGCTFIGNGSGTGIYSNNAALEHVLIGNTFYGLDEAFQVSAQMTYPPTIINNHATDCAKWLDNPTADTYAFELCNRTRDNTTPRTNIGDGINVGEVTTDTGDKDTDYTDADNDDFHLIAAAPGVEAALDDNAEIGAYQNAAGAGGGGGGPGNMSGGLQ